MSYDLVVIGGGPAGEKAATQAAYFHKKVALVERRPSPGGVAVSDAGIPTKTLRETAQYITGFRHRDVYGIGLSLDAGLKLDRLFRRTAEVQQLMTEVVRGNLARMGVEVIQGEGRLGPDGTVLVGERSLSAKVILIATGSRPYRPPGIPFDDPAVADSEKIVRLDRLPRDIVVIGGGAIGCEYASIFTALGLEVTLVEGAPALLGFCDREISNTLAEIFVKYGTRVRTGEAISTVQRRGARIAVEFRSGETIESESVLFAGGRSGNTEGLGLEAAGVAVDDKGRIKVDATYRTTAPRIYAAGDVIGPPALASVSMEQGRVAVCNAFDIPFKETVDPLPPLGVYCIPEVAMVGLTEEAARAQGIDYEVGRCPFARNTRARIAGATDGLVKLVFRRKDRLLLGAHIIGDVAAELIHLGQSVVSQGRTIDYFIHATFNVPTYSEAYKYAAYDGLQRLAGRPTIPQG
jgi:NAD(P) transhydrogenase